MSKGYDAEEENRTYPPAGHHRCGQLQQRVIIAAVCLFFIPPLGEIASSAISIVNELLVLCGAILGVKASYGVKFRQFEAELRDVIENEKKLNS